MYEVKAAQRQAIQVKFLCPTNTLGSRYKAFCEAGSLTVPADHSLNVSDNKAAACAALVRKLGWKGTWVGGGLPNGDEVFVLLTD